jgi:hypothetical protein
MSRMLLLENGLCLLIQVSFGEDRAKTQIPFGNDNKGRDNKRECEGTMR